MKGSLNELMACKSWCSATFRIELIVLNRFRWVFCQLDRLRHCLSPRIRQALDELPGTLDETYERALLDIGEDNWAYAHRLFQCVVVAQRPLRVEELAEFLAFKSGEGGSLTFEEDWRPEDPRDTVLSTCSSLIAIVNVDDSQVIQFSHFSVKEYLTSIRIAEGRVALFDSSRAGPYLRHPGVSFIPAPARQTCDEKRSLVLPACSICYSILDKPRRIRGCVVTH